jgi:hypothetical protein
MLHHYPIDQEANRTQLIDLAERYGYEVIEPQKNLGLHHGLNWAVRQIGIGEDDLLIGVDPGRSIETLGWDTALAAVAMDPKIGWAALSNHASPTEISQRPHKVEQINGVKVALCQSPMMIQTAICKMDWVLQSGGFREPTNYYGGIEIAMWESLKRKYELGILLDYKETGDIAAQQDPIYRDWKLAHVKGEFRGNFDEYVKCKQ